MRIVTWNTAHRTSRVSEQLQFLSTLQPDVVALQEITKNTYEKLSMGLRELGLHHVVHTADSSGSGPRQYGVLTASRLPLIKAKSPIDVVWPEKLLSVGLRLKRRHVDIHNVHVPSGAGDRWEKIQTLEQIYSSLSVMPKFSRVLCGDFNLPREEWKDGTVVTWGQNVGKNCQVTIPKRRGVRWHLGEWNVAVGLQAFGMRDAFREVNGLGHGDFSWIAKNKGNEFPYRLDHLHSDLTATTAQFVHSAREQGLSDHSPLLVELHIP